MLMLDIPSGDSLMLQDRETLFLGRVYELFEPGSRKIPELLYILYDSLLN